jgi:hypothetical protein
MTRWNDLMGVTGMILLAVNVCGFAVPLRSPDIDGYRDFAGIATTRFSESSAALRRLSESQATPVDFVTEATRIFHAGIAHVAPRDVRANGLDHYRMRVPLTENWILFALSYLKPDTYRDYEFCSYRKALERGTGRCGQQSMALVSFLEERGFQTGFVELGGHSIATVKVAPSKWYLLDADYGGVIPFDIQTAERSPSSVLRYYWSSAARDAGLDALFDPAGNQTKYGGPDARYARACPFERAAYAAKWLLPGVLVIPLLVTSIRKRSGRIEGGEIEEASGQADTVNITRFLASLLGGVLFLHSLRRLSFWRYVVVNTDDAGVITARGDGKRQDPTVPGLIRFRTYLAPVLQPGQGALETVAALRHWARTQQSQDLTLWRFSPSADSGDVDPGVLLQQQRALRPGACRRFAYVLAGALLSAGIAARIVSLQAFFTDGLGHIMVEAWIEPLNKWVLVDPTCNTMFLVDGRYASLLELRKALLEGRLESIEFERNGSNLEPAPSLEYLAQIARHAFVITNECLFTDPPLRKADVWRFPVVHYVDEHAEPYPSVHRAMTIAWQFSNFLRTRS